jgi:subfamily B ATP-binding cassette protein HlyB/CyaB
MSTAIDNATAADPGLESLVMLLQFQGIAADRGQIRHRLGTVKIGAPEMHRCAKDLGLKARAYRTDWSRLVRTPLPAIASLRDGGFMLIAKASKDKVLVQSPLAPKPALMSRAELNAVWDRGLILMTRRAGLQDLARRFDVTWFLGAIQKYRHLLYEVLIASFFLQMFALVSPLFFQVVIDKVLVHRALSTLDVLIVGLLAISIFETVLGILRTHLFSHTTNRIDVELGARLFHHLLALPMAYFQARRVGDSVARVRELEHIRNFLTSSALTLAIDLFFTFVFVAVMFFYSPLLTAIVLGSFPFYIAISAGATPLFRRRLDEKFRRGAENQAFLVESVTGIETLKAMAVEPQMQRQWEEQLAGYVAASFRVLSLGNSVSQVVQLVSKVATAGILYFGAKLVIEGSLSVGELVAFNILAGRVSTPVLRLAQIWQDFHQARLSIARLGDILNTTAEPTYTTARTRLPAIRGHISFDHVTFRYRIDGPEVLHDVSFDVAAGQTVAVGIGQEHIREAGSTPLRPGERPRSDRRHGPRHGRPGVAASPDRRRPAGERAVQPLSAREYRARRSGVADGTHYHGGDACGSARLHPGAPRGLRHDRRRTRRESVGWPAPAYRHCSRAHHRSAHSDLR